MLDAAKKGVLRRTYMLQEGVLPARSQNAPDFSHDPLRIGDRAQEQAGDHSIGRLIVEVDGVAGDGADLDIDAVSGGTPLKTAMHIGIGLWGRPVWCVACLRR